ncbi:hypothetical protein [Laceyella putida]|uniref:Uncharacterized protein n=1 Tax=Laceyella putida TaxID=110101 RepID=A0ABW2RM04_9BACL
MLEQSRANLKEKVIEVRLEFYPQLEQSLREIGELFPKHIRDEQWTDATNKLKQIFDDKKYYISRELRVKVRDLLSYINYVEKRTEIEKDDQILDKLIEKCLEDIEKSMDLSSFVDLD